MDDHLLHNLTGAESLWLQSNLAVSDPLVVDITAGGGGSIPFEIRAFGGYAPSQTT